MGLFQKRPQNTVPITFTTFGMNKTLLIVGLGNPGKEYDLTRHNIGFLCLDDFSAKNNFDPWINKKDLQAVLTQQTMNETRVILIKPTTFMNNSGEAVQAVAHFYKIHPGDIIVVHDELDIPFGQVRMRVGGSSAGHNGIKSVTKHLGEEYGRVRIGIGPKKPAAIDSADFVLQKFTAAQQKNLPALTREVSSILSEYAYGSPVAPETRSFLL